MITHLTTMNFVFFVFLISSIVSAQVIAPCVTQCTIDMCPDGVSDHPCFCVAQAVNIQKCINATCDTASIGDGQMIFQQQCMFPCDISVDLLRWLYYGNKQFVVRSLH